jgi:predicted acylesterase/phospholipase RssA
MKKAMLELARRRLICVVGLCVCAFIPSPTNAQSAGALGTGKVALAALATAERGDCSQPIPKRHAALTVEGGGTLGTYEGGFTWALTEIFRQRRLMARRVAFRDTTLDALLRCLPEYEFHAAAGASAGSINAFIAANEWCSSGEFVRDEDSRFWRVWVAMGLSDLLPHKRDPEWKSETGLFTRTRFGELFAELDSAWKNARYSDTPCSVAFGAAITRLADDSLTLSNQVHARNQRYAAAFTIAGATGPGGSGPQYMRPPQNLNEKLRLGSLVELPLNTSGRISHNFAHALIKASSGYPLAFEPHPVQYCKQPDIPLAQAHGTVPCAERAAHTAYFVDGGVFDNGPLTLSYALALADAKQVSLDNLYMLYVNPGRRRLSGASRDRYSVGPRHPTDSAHNSPALGPRDSTSIGEDKLEGLDAVAKLFATFVPSARQYELQIAARFLPTVQAADRRLTVDSARLARAEQSNIQLRGASDSEYAIRRSTLNEGLKTAAALKDERDSIRYELSRCRLSPLSCGIATAEDSVMPFPRHTVTQDSTPPRVPVDTNYVVVDAASQQFDSLLFVSERWHPLGGDWLFGFGGFIGRPLREYDFYVGEYDALAFIAGRMLCTNPRDSFCYARQLVLLISDPGLPLTARSRAALRALYDEEFREYRQMELKADRDFAALSTSSDSLEYPVLISIVKAMSSKMSRVPLTANECQGGGAIGRLSCLEGMDSVFSRLRADRSILQRLGQSTSECSALPDQHPCMADVRFKRFVENPHVALNQLAGEMLQRASQTTPGDSHLKFPLIVANAFYLATNERAREGTDAGSVSLPTLTGWNTLFYLVPSSVGGFAGIPGWYTEWTARYHFNQTLAIGVAPRVVWRSGLSRSSPIASGNMFIPAFRAELKMPSRLGAPLISTVGADFAWWNDWDFHEFGQGAPGRGTTTALTTSLLAQRVRVSIYKRPAKYSLSSGNEPATIVSIGAGDTSGLAYWLKQIVFR